ncbi:MAG: mechanosensitive ion channel protein MscS [Bdellovibrio sp.]|nr:MAG: mechanosensitive ion channel protein MscS [Bdellovibrio sp.]
MLLANSEVKLLFLAWAARPPRGQFREVSVEQELYQLVERLAGGGPLTWLILTALAGLLSFVASGVASFLTSKIRRFASPSPSLWNRVAVDSLEKLKNAVLFVWFFYLLSHTFLESPKALKIIHTVTVLTTVAQLAIWGQHGILLWREYYLRQKFTKDKSSAAAMGLLYASAQGILFVTLVLFGLSNLGFDIRALLAGLGVGGVAVALAAQNILGDVLASLSIVLDKPFMIGDFIVVGPQMGTVEYVGIKTTRLRSLSGEELIFSNKDLLESRIQNFKRMFERRVLHTYGVPYSTPTEKLKQIPDWIKAAIARHPQLRLERCHLAKFSDSAITFETVFWVADPDYNLFMDLQQKVLLEIRDAFTAQDVQFAYPTQSIFLHGSS